MSAIFYEIESYRNGWNKNELSRQYGSSLYERLALSRDKDEVMRLALEGQVIESPEDIFKDPYVLEFTGLPEMASYLESDLEEKIIDHLQQFLLELGRGFTFVGRQVRFTFEEDHYRVDLVTYNRLLRCFVLFDLKIGQLKHEDLGQMQMYVNYYDRKVKMEDENPTIGIIICKDKKDAVIEMTLPENNNQIFAVSIWKYAGYEKELKSLQKMLGEILQNIKSPVPDNMSFADYYESIWETDQIMQVPIYGYFQFKSVQMALEGGSELAAVFEEMGIYKEINKNICPYKEYLISAETAKEVLNDLQHLLNNLGIEQPVVDIELVNDPTVQCGGMFAE